MSEVKKPQPAPTDWTQTFWKSCSSNRLKLLRCLSCDSKHLPTRLVCTCGSTDFEWVESIGTGAIISFTIVHRAPDPAFKGELPYVIAIIDLQEGARLMSNIIDSNLLEIAIGKKVECVFEKIDEEIGVPKFKLLID